MDPARAARAIRTVAATLCLGTIAGMITCAATRHLGGVVTLGCVTVGVIAVVMAISAVGVGSGSSRSQSPPANFDERAAQSVERLVLTLSNRENSEAELRDLVGAAVRLGQSSVDVVRAGANE